MSATLVPELMRAFALLSSKGVTERREASISLRKLLSIASNLRTIDENTDGRRRNSLTWDHIFLKTNEYVNLEVDNVMGLNAKNKEKTLASSTIEGRKKRIRDAVSFMRCIIHIADARGPRLKVQDVVIHITVVLNDPSRSTYLASSYCEILLKNILAIPTYRPEITPKHWQELLELFVTFVTAPPSWAPKHQLMVARILQLLYAGAQFPLKNSIHFNFFTRIFKDVREDMNIPYIECLLASLNSFAMSVADDCRGQVCHLGESIFPEILNLWRKPAMPFKDQIVTFLQLQMSVHHPFGTHTDLEGAWCSNVNHWKKCTQKLYDVIVSYIEQLGARIRGAGAKMDPNLKLSFLDLAADILHQVLWSHSSCHAVDVGNNSSHSGSSTKKRRIEVGWHVVRDTLESGPEGLAMLSWLQILSALFQKHPSSIPSGEFVPMISTLHQIQSNCKRQETTGNVLKCLESFALCFAQRKEQLSQGVLEYMGTVWKTVWTAVLKTVGVKHHREYGYSFLTTLVMEKLVVPDLDAWKVLCSSTPTRGSLEFLAAYLQLHPLPEGFMPVSPLILSSSPLKKNPFPLRHQLLDWILPVSADTTETSRAIIALLTGKTSANMRLVAEVLTALTQKVPSTAEFTIHKTKQSRVPEDNASQYQAELHALEQLYLNSSFEGKGEVYQDLREQSSTDGILSRATENSRVELLCSLLVERLSNTHEQLTEMLDAEPLGTTGKERLYNLSWRTEGMIRYCTLVCHVIALMMDTLPQGPLNTLPLMKKVGIFLTKIEKAFNELLTMRDAELAARAESTTCLLGTLRELFQVGNAKQDALLAVIKSVTPVRLVEHILEIYQGKWGQSLLGCSRIDVMDGSVLNLTSGMTSSDEDGFDDFDAEMLPNDDESSLSSVAPQTTERTAKGGKTKKRIFDYCNRAHFDYEN